jgi:hypothetical protein
VLVLSGMWQKSWHLFSNSNMRQTWCYKPYQMLNSENFPKSELKTRLCGAVKPERRKLLNPNQCEWLLTLCTNNFMLFHFCCKTIRNPANQRNYKLAGFLNEMNWVSSIHSNHFDRIIITLKQVHIKSLSMILYYR